jgi:hypothetical protein
MLTVVNREYSGLERERSRHRKSRLGWFNPKLNLSRMKMMEHNRNNCQRVSQVDALNPPVRVRAQSLESQSASKGKARREFILRAVQLLAMMASCQ